MVIPLDNIERRISCEFIITKMAAGDNCKIKMKQDSIIVKDVALYYERN